MSRYLVSSFNETCRRSSGSRPGKSRDQSAGAWGTDPEDFGPERVGWLGQLVSDWMGDDGTLKKFSCQIRGPDMMGDINTIKGKVAKKYIENGEHLVDCEIFCENQGGNVTAPGRATVALPSRS